MATSLKPKASKATTLTGRMFETSIDLPENVRGKVIETLNLSLATLADLRSQVKQAHWNVKGSDFYQLHTLFDTLYEELIPFVDMVAERATTLGGTAFGTARMTVQNTLLPEYPLDLYEGMGHVKALVERYAIAAKQVREYIDQTDEWGDADTADLYTEISRALDMRLWFLQAHLQTP